jgi:lauroyl/myristoyl acyltransferase
MPEAAQALWSIFEPIISRQPAPWLWMYKHWRFLPRDADDGGYPAYANPNKAFDRLDKDSQV